MDTPQPAPKRRVADLGAITALAHPIRLDLYDALSQYGPATASMLGERLGESSGSTSYHLRILAKHELVREVEGRGTARERWWERTPGGLTLHGGPDADEATRLATGLVVEHWNANRAALLADFVERGFDELPGEWVDASTVSTINLRLTSAQLAEIVERFDHWIDELIEPYQGREDPGSRPVQLHFNAFPLLDGTETPS